MKQFKAYPKKISIGILALDSDLLPQTVVAGDFNHAGQLDLAKWAKRTLQFVERRDSK